MRVNFYGLSALGGRSGTDQLLDVRFGGKTVQVRDAFTSGLSLSPASVAPGQPATYRFEFLYENNQGILKSFQPLEGHYFVVTFRFADGTTAQYFIDPRT